MLKIWAIYRKIFNTTKPFCLEVGLTPTHVKREITMLEILYFLLVATFISFAALILSGHRPKGESKLTGAIYLGAILIVTVLVYGLWRRQPAAALLLAAAYSLLVGLAWVALPNWNTRGHAFLVSFSATQVVFLVRILAAILLSGLSWLALVVSLILFSAELTVVCLTIYFMPWEAVIIEDFLVP